MTMDLTGPGGDLHFNHTSWRLLLDLAYDYGWRPTGTVPPNRKRPDEYRGYYDSNEGWKVTYEDAIGIAEALEKSLEDLPNRNVMPTTDKQVIGIPKTNEIPLIMPDLKLIKDLPKELQIDIDTSVTAREYFSGERKKRVLEFIAFCRKGSFYLW